MGGGGKRKKKWFSFITQIIGMLTGLGSLFNTVFGVFGKVSETFNTVTTFVKDTVAPIWNFVKPFYNFVDKTIWPIVKGLVDETKKITTFVNDVLKKVEKITDDLYSKTVGPLFDLWKSFEALRDSSLRLISLVSKDLAKEIYEKTELVRKQTLGRIEHVYSELKGVIEDYRTVVMFRINTVMDFMNKRVNEVSSALGDFQKIMGETVESPGRLRRGTVEIMAREQGTTIVKGVAEGSESPITETTIRIYNRTPSHVFTDQMIQVMDQGLKGDWADVEEYQEASISHMDNYEELEGFELHEGLLTTAEISYLETLKEEPKETQ